MKFLWLFDKDALLTLIPLHSLLFSLGGSGVKPLRRFGIPLITLLSALSMGANWLCATISSAALFGSLGLGYGDQLKAKAGSFYFVALGFIGVLYGLSFAPLSWSNAHVFALIGCFSVQMFFYLSQKFKWFEWKLAEMFIGAILGAFAVLSLK